MQRCIDAERDGVRFLEIVPASHANWKNVQRSVGVQDDIAMPLVVVVRVVPDACVTGPRGDGVLPCLPQVAVGEGRGLPVHKATIQDIVLMPELGDIALERRDNTDVRLCRDDLLDVACRLIGLHVGERLDARQVRLSVHDIDPRLDVQVRRLETEIRFAVGDNASRPRGQFVRCTDLRWVAAEWGRREVTAVAWHYAFLSFQPVSGLLNPCRLLASNSNGCKWKFGSIFCAYFFSRFAST